MSSRRIGDAVGSIVVSTIAVGSIGIADAVAVGTDRVVWGADA